MILALPTVAISPKIARMGRKATSSPDKPQRIYVSHSVKEGLIEWADSRMGVDLTIVASRALRWFLKQDPLVQDVITGRTTQGMEAAYANALRALANELDPQHIKVNLPPPPQAGGGSAESRGGQERKKSSAA